MRGASVLVFLGLCGHWVAAQFLNNKPFPTYSLENMPETVFSCRDKILGGYYADPDTQCQMFHVCVKVAGVGIQDFRFLCPNGTAFDQDHQICADWEDVDCDASTLYYSSDNFDLYRLGSGYESKALKYGEDEETFALQRAETGDHRLNREHQSNSVNQQKQASYSGRPRTPVNRNNNNNNNNNNNEKDIFKGSSSSNFFNNRNNGKERDEDYDENVNVNQDRDFEQRRKVVRNKVRRPAQSNRQNQNGESNRSSNNNQNTDSNRANTNNQNAEPSRGNINNQNSDYNRGNTNNQNADHSRGNINNQNSDYNRGNNNQNGATRNNNNQNGDSNRNNNNGDYNRRNQNDYATKAAPKVEFDPTKRPAFVNNFAGSSYIPTTSKPPSTTNEQSTTATANGYRTRPAQRTREYDSPSPTYTISTPAPFKQTQQYNQPPARATTATENYPQQKPRTSTQEPAKPRQTTPGQNYESTKVKYDKTENYPSNNPQYFEKKPTTPFRQHQQQPEDRSTTQAAPRSFATFPTIPTTFAPRTSAAYAQLEQQTKQQAAKLSTSKATPFTQYTPTVPKVASTTPIARSSRFDETQYDDGSYNPKYDYDADRREDEFLKTAHSQNIAASRNEYAKATTKQQQQQPQRTTAYESPRPFSVTAAAAATTSTAQPPRAQTDAQKTTPKNGQAAVKANLNPKKTKDASYDYAYYDTSVGSEPDYDVNTEIKKSTVKN